MAMFFADKPIRVSLSNCEYCDGVIATVRGNLEGERVTGEFDADDLLARFDSHVSICTFDIGFGTIRSSLSALLSSTRLHSITMRHVTGDSDHIVQSFVGSHAQEISLIGMDFTVQLSGVLSANPVLTSLLLHGCMIEPGSLAALSGHAQLQSLELDLCSLGEDEIDALSELPNLASISLSGTQVGDGELLQLTQVSSLQRLNVSYTNVTGQGIAEFQKARPTVALLAMD